ncbi:MAG: hypothetical protein FJ147_22070 [Deltaproteobacteria bacterium]|nr:hypothetical protein [Deltaproteobacteria bacterium]
MQQKHKGMQRPKSGGEKSVPTTTRERAARAKTASSAHPKTSQDHTSTKPVPQNSQRQASYVKETSTSSSSLEFRSCSLVGPDGQKRPGWELWVNGMMFGRADSKETLLAYHARLYEPLPSGHWKDRAWQPIKKKPVGKRTAEEPASRFDDEEAEPELEVESSWTE